MSSTIRVSLTLVALAIAAFAALVASPIAAAFASSGEFTRAEANVNWTQGSIAGTASWGGGCATAAPCEFQPYVTVGTSECSSNERRWPHSNAQLALAWSGAEQAGSGSASFDVSEVALSGEPGQLACLSLLETYEERPDCQLHPQPGTACPMYIIDVQNSSVLASAPLTVPSSGPPATSPPTIESESASNNTPTDATLEAEINPQSLERGVHYQFQVVTDTNEYLPEFACPTEGFPAGTSLCLGLGSQAGALPISGTPAGTQDQSVSLDLAGAGMTLQPGMTYHYRVIAARIVQTEDTIAWEPPIVYGPDQTFTTPSGSAPAIESESLSHLTTIDATLEAQINTEGLATSYQFRLESGCLPPLACLAIAVYPLPSGELLGSFVGQSVSLDLNSAGVNLHPSTKYRYSIEATNSAGTTEGSGQMFTTPSEPGAEPLAGPSGSTDPQSSTATQSTLSASSSQPGWHHRRGRYHRRHKHGLHRSKLYRAKRAG